MITINHVMRQLVEELLKLKKYQVISTHQFPKGHPVTAKLGALLGNVVATHKVAGFLSHSGTRPCLWCDVVKKDLHLMKMGNLWNRMATLATARRWLDASATERSASSMGWYLVSCITGSRGYCSITLDSAGA
ncbi:hypothetical protein VP01_2324g4 [Puccinia sorghi]|uniref:Uncharacterized protein n=1 Tax=Puccinia sorghi TaxID=27349 RepID=A0A0L6V895_9BASI|nr:hypothetical protein VP01_2324g4 [Puccinia sorghi]